MLPLFFFSPHVTLSSGNQFYLKWTFVLLKLKMSTIFLLLICWNGPSISLLTEYVNLINSIFSHGMITNCAGNQKNMVESKCFMFHRITFGVLISYFTISKQSWAEHVMCSVRNIFIQFHNNFFFILFIFFIIVNCSMFVQSTKSQFCEIVLENLAYAQMHYVRGHRIDCLQIDIMHWTFYRFFSNSKWNERVSHFSIHPFYHFLI